MNSLVIFGLLILLFIRLLALGISIEFFMGKNRFRFKFFIIGWTIWALAAIFAIIGSIYENGIIMESMFVLNGISASIGAIVVVMGFRTYFRQVPIRLLAIICILLITVPLIVSIIGYEYAVRFSSIMLYLFILSLVIMGIIDRKDYKSIGGYSYIWLYVSVFLGAIIIVILISLLIGGYQYGLYGETDDVAIIVNYFFGIGITTLFLILMIHLEHTITNQEKFQLKDSYSHNLGNIIQVIFSASLLTGMGKTAKEESEKLQLIQKKCNEASEVIKEIRKL
ncbi:MAG: hypothetical protein ACFFC7_13310 [Candidatus Hermodarchaeota archaeon]